MQLKSQVIWLVFTLALVYMLACQGCATVAGLGEDITDCANASKVALQDYAAK